MRYILAILFSIGCIRTVTAQHFTIADFNKRQQKTDRTAFTVLGSWAVGNIVYGSIASGSTNGSNKYFHQMNAIWNSVNLGLAVMGYVGTTKEITGGYAGALKNQVKLEKTFLFNAGLDLVYITGGLYLRERSGNVVKDSDKFKGYGESLLLQGGGLLLFDAIMYVTHTKHGKQLYKLADKVQLTVSPASMGMIVKL